jgi:hypothetical protein
MRKVFNLLLITLGATLTVGCIPKGTLLKSRDIQLIDAGYAVDRYPGCLLESDAAVDAVASNTIKVLGAAGFKLMDQSISYGVLPLTGHTQNLIFHREGRDRIRALVLISGSKFSATFEELEAAPNTHDYYTTEQDRAAISNAVSSIKEFINTQYPGRAARISHYTHPKP